jgi:hypothetical protein
MRITRHSQPKPPLRDLLALEAVRIRDAAKAFLPSLAHDAMLRKARVAETASHINDWLASRGLQPQR